MILLCDISPGGNLWDVAVGLNTLLASENERLRQLTDGLQQKYSHMTSEVGVWFVEYLSVRHNECSHCVSVFSPARWAVRQTVQITESASCRFL